MKPKITAAQLDERTLHRRAIEAIVWGIPAVNYDLMLQSMIRDAKGAMNQVLYWSGANSHDATAVLFPEIAPTGGRTYRAARHRL